MDHYTRGVAIDTPRGFPRTDAEQGSVSGNLDIRAMTRGELDTAIEWAAAEGWNPGLADGDPFYNADPTGFFRASLNGRMAACVSAIRYGADYGFVGFYICHPDYRGRGLGWQTWQAGLAHVSGRTVGLDGVVAQVANYEKSGFALAHRNIRFSGIVSCAPPADARLRPIDAGLADAVAAYDTPFFPARREGFLQDWLAAAPTRRGYALVTDGRRTGYGVIRQCREGYKVGPLFADDAGAADVLFRALAATASGAVVSLDPPEPHAQAIALAERWGMAPVFETARMYRGPAPDLPLQRTFGITTFELG